MSTTGGSFLIEDQAPGDVFTPEDFTEEHRDIARAAREFLDSLIQAHHAENRSNFRDAYYNWLRGAESLRDAILESLSQEDG